MKRNSEEIFHQFHSLRLDTDLRNLENGTVPGNFFSITFALTGEISIKTKYDDLKEAKSGILIAKESGKYGIIDLEENTKIEFKYTEENVEFNKNEMEDINEIRGNKKNVNFTVLPGLFCNGAYLDIGKIQVFTYTQNTFHFIDKIFYD